MSKAPSFVPLKHIVSANLLDCKSKRATNPELAECPTERVLQISYEKSPTPF